MPSKKREPAIVKDLSEFGLKGFDLYITGTNAGSDQAWNYFRGQLLLRNAKEVPCAHINVADFTRNCGVKSVSKIWIAHAVDPKKWWALVTSMLHNKARAGILVGSDTVDGNTYHWLKEFGFTLTEPVWNPVYTWDKSHKITVGHLFLKDIPATSIWKQLPQSFNEEI